MVLGLVVVTDENLAVHRRIDQSVGCGKKTPSSPQPTRERTSVARPTIFRILRVINLSVSLENSAQLTHHYPKRLHDGWPISRRDSYLRLILRRSNDPKFLRRCMRHENLLKSDSSLSIVSKLPEFANIKKW
jgi:hypothetical protein